MTRPDTRKGIACMIAATLVFSVQDALSRHLGETNNVFVIVMIRYWFFAAFVVALALKAPGGLGRALRPRFPVIQVLRGVMLVAEICIMVVAFVKLGLVATHAVFTCFPLLVAALSGPVLGEYVGWRRWTAVAVGLVGVLVILQPGGGVLSLWSVLPFAAALLFALYGLLTRYVAAEDGAAVSFFWAGTSGAVAITMLGLWFWEPLSEGSWPWMAALCVTGIIGHWCMIRAYDYAEASAIQPFSFLQLVWASIIGVAFLGESLTANVVIGAGIVVAAGLFTLWRADKKGEAPTPVARP
ncbi:DMT family transporter [Falsirhodobacter deserti]|uniref:DMT family transporter n=1 Tax=Falsirhodobacter deserti TaxID=1365611 RepID=UPI000FE38153|nr:DMT family transporter [Falsirhodobacter deserti]